MKQRIFAIVASAIVGCFVCADCVFGGSTAAVASVGIQEYPATVFIESVSVEDSEVCFIRVPSDPEEGTSAVAIGSASVESTPTTELLDTDCDGLPDSACPVMYASAYACR